MARLLMIDGLRLVPIQFTGSSKSVAVTFVVIVATEPSAAVKGEGQWDWPGLAAWVLKLAGVMQPINFNQGMQG
jgi:hypothetical protein